MEVEYELTVADTQAFVRFQQKIAPKPKPHPLIKWLTFLVRLVLVVLFALIYWFSMHPGNDWILGWCYGVLCGIAFTAAAIGLHAKLTIANSNRLFEREESRWLLARRRLKITPDGFEITNGYEQLFYRWSVVWLIDSTDEHAFFCTSFNQAHVIPRRAFQNRRDFEDFIDLACRYHKGLPPRESTATEILDALPADQTGITVPRHP